MSALSKSNSTRIRELNDAFRQTFVGGRVVITEGIDALNLEIKAQVINQVRHFDQFDHDNDPHGEHDFGNFEIAGNRFYFKIDTTILPWREAQRTPRTRRKPRA